MHIHVRQSRRQTHEASYWLRLYLTAQNRTSSRPSFLPEVFPLLFLLRFPLKFWFLEVYRCQTSGLPSYEQGHRVPRRLVNPALVEWCGGILFKRSVFPLF
jgi:hypothetical protein